MAQQIAAIRRDLNIENGVVGKMSRSARRCALRATESESGRIFGDPKFFRTAQHSLRFDAAQFARLDLEPVRQIRARQRQRNLVADSVVLRTANDLAGFSAAVVDLTNTQSIGIRMRRRIFNLSNDDFVEIRPAIFDGFDFDAGQREQFRRALTSFGSSTNSPSQLTENFMR